MCRLSGRSFIKNIWASVPNDRDGCLQDSHWSNSAFGYFPSYALGSALALQMLRRMEQDVDVWGAAAKGDLTPITAWLREKVHQYGGLMEPADVVKNACGDFSAELYQYLTRRVHRTVRLIKKNWRLHK